MPDEGRVSSSCHCGKTADGHLDGYCQECSDVRCDAYPGACSETAQGAVTGRVSSPHDQCHAMAAESYDHGFADGVIEARKDAEVHCDCGKSYVGEECFRDYDA